MLKMQVFLEKNKDGNKKNVSVQGDFFQKSDKKDYSKMGMVFKKITSSRFAASPSAKTNAFL